MKNVIAFMEQLGASAELQNLTEAEALSMMQQHLDVAAPESLHSEVANILDVRKNLVCGVAVAEEGDDAIETVTNSADGFVGKVESVLDARKNLVCGIMAAEETDEEQQAA